MIRISRVTISDNFMGRYVAEVEFSHIRYRGVATRYYATYYRYYFSDSSLYDELRSDNISKKRMRELATFCRKNAQKIMRHNDDEFHRID